jgi:hypothetical protein
VRDAKIRSDISAQSDRLWGNAVPSRAAWIGFLMAISCASPLLAQDSGLQIHGFGGWSYGKTDHGNLYLGGLPEGNYDRAELSLNLEDQLSDRLRVAVQTDFDQTEMGHDTGIDYAFVEWRFSDKLRIRAGQVKLPFGIYAEITDVGTLRPFLRLPQGVYGPVGFAGENYKGIGITGTLNGASKWSYAYDLYAGGTQLEEFLPPEAFLRGQPVSTSTEVESESTRNVLGGRFTVRTPIDGLELGVSAYSGTLIAAGSPQRSVAATHASFVNDRWSIRSEFAYEHSSHDLTARGFYLEPAYHITQHWQVAAQYDHLSTQLSGVPNPSEPSFLIHREVAVGLNYWVSPKAVFKTSFQRVNGNRFAGPVPESYAQLVAAGELQHKTSLVMFGVNFSF